MKFDSSQAWKQAAAWVSANRDVLVALSGVFILLPSLAVSLLAPQPQPAAGLTPEQLMQVTRGYYLQALPYVIPMLLLQALGTLAMLTLFTDRRRPTVRESLTAGLRGIAPYVLAQLILGITVGIGGGLLVGIASLSGSPPVLYAVIALIIVAAVYLAVRTSLSGPVVAVERVRNPVAALTRSWHLTAGNSGRLTLFYVLIALAFTVAISVIMALVGIVLVLLLGPANAQVAAAVVSAALSAAMTVYFIAVLGAVHRQLGGPSHADQVATFE